MHVIDVTDDLHVEVQTAGQSGAPPTCELSEQPMTAMCRLTAMSSWAGEPRRHRHEHRGSNKQCATRPTQAPLEQCCGLYLPTYTNCGTPLQTQISTCTCRTFKPQCTPHCRPRRPEAAPCFECNEPFTHASSIPVKPPTTYCAASSVSFKTDSSNLSVLTMTRGPAVQQVQNPMH